MTPMIEQALIFNILVIEIYLFYSGPICIHVNILFDL